LTVSKACFSGVSSWPSGLLARAALIPPWAAPEWLRPGCTWLSTATSMPASLASTAARSPARPPPTTSI